MLPHQLTTLKLIKGKLLNCVNVFVKPSTASHELNGYKLIKLLSDQTVRDTGFVGIYKDSEGKDVFIKTHNFKVKDLDYEYLSNEAFILRILSKYDERVFFPKYVGYIENKCSVSVVSSMLDGNSMEKLGIKDPTVIKSNIYKSLSYLESVSKKLSDEDKGKLPKRTYGLLFLTFLFFWVRALVKDIKIRTGLLKAFFSFYKYYLSANGNREDLYLTHRDLYPSNILIDQKGNTYIVDWENAVLSDRLGDLSYIPRIFFNELSEKEHMEIIRNYIKTEEEKKRFIALTVFNTIQTLALYSKSHEYYETAVNYLESIFNFYIPVLFTKKSLFEHIYARTLTAIYYLNKIFPPFAKLFRPHVILCYHSISNDGWRFSTKIEDFRKQMDILVSKYKVVPLNNLLLKCKNEKCASITFDDGYENNYMNAKPVLDEKKTTATIFMLGDVKKANRYTMDNALALMSKEQVIGLHNCGWEIGYHTKTHADLAKSSRGELQEEIYDGKKEFENNMGFTLNYFAYPFGNYDSETIKMLEKAGFTAAFTVDGYSFKVNNKMLINRIPIEGTLTSKQFEAMISPLGIINISLLLKVLKIKAKIMKGNIYI